MRPVPSTQKTRQAILELHIQNSPTPRCIASLTAMCAWIADYRNRSIMFSTVPKSADAHKFLCGGFLLICTVAAAPTAYLPAPHRGFSTSSGAFQRDHPLQRLNGLCFGKQDTLPHGPRTTSNDVFSPCAPPPAAAPHGAAVRSFIALRPRRNVRSLHPHQRKSVRSARARSCPNGAAPRRRSATARPDAQTATGHPRLHDTCKHRGLTRKRRLLRRERLGSRPRSAGKIQSNEAGRKFTGNRWRGGGKKKGGTHRRPRSSTPSIAISLTMNSGPLLDAGRAFA